MRRVDEHTLELPLAFGVVQAQQRLVLPPAVIAKIGSYRQACRLAWKLRRARNLTLRSLAERCPGLYASHISDYFSVEPYTKKGKPRRELPARHVAEVEAELGNTVINQWLAHRGQLTVLEELQAERARRAAA